MTNPSTMSPNMCPFTSVRLKLEQIHLVANHAFARFVAAARKGLLDGHLLEKSDRKNL